MTTNRNHDDASSSSMMIKTNDFGHWSDLNDDVLLLVMMRMGVIDFLAFSGVCKLWRSLAWTNRLRFMKSKPPMLLRISTRGTNDKECCLEDYEGRKFKTILPHSAGRSFVGLTCGYLILVSWKTKDFWLVNPITRHELHFPPAPCAFNGVPQITSVLVFSPLISTWVFIMSDFNKIWFSIAGDGSWHHVSSTFRFTSFHVFMKKIYTISSDADSWKVRHLHEFALTPEPKLTLIETKNLLDKDFILPKLVSWGENLYVMESLAEEAFFMVYKLDFGEMEWVPFQDIGDESDLSNDIASVKQDSWADTRLQHSEFNVADEGENVCFFAATDKWTWYFPNESLNENLLDE